MNGPTHKLAGAIAAVVITQNDKKNNLSTAHHPGVAIPIGYYLGKLPDIIEPSLGNPNHRQFFHSVVTLGLVTSGLHKIYKWEPKDELEKIVRGLILIGGAAYISHLLLDSLTQRSLPFIGKI